jgi:hypothetical protein
MMIVNKVYEKKKKTKSFQLGTFLRHNRMTEEEHACTHTGSGIKGKSDTNEEARKSRRRPL